MTTPLLWAAMALVGACAGSFIATAVVRSVRGEAFLTGRSHCDACGRALGFGQTVPVLSYVALRGACADCGSPISRLHPLAEVAGGTVAVAAALQPGWSQGLLVAALGAALLTTALIDGKTERLPDGLTLVIAAVCGGLAWLKGDGQIWVGFVAAASAFAILELLRRAFLHRRGVGGLGFGDVKLIAALALWLGLLTPWAIVAASLAGLAAYAMARPESRRLAFGPYIAGAAFVVGLTGSLAPWLT